MQNWYYKIWTDAIVSQQQKKGEHTSWKLYTIVPMSVLQGINLFTFFYWMKVIVNRDLLLTMPVGIFGAHPLNGFVSVLITFFIPFVILNYLLIFYNDRFKMLVDKYGSAGGTLHRKYALWSLGLAIIPAIVKFAFFG